MAVVQEASVRLNVKAIVAIENVVILVTVADAATVRAPIRLTNVVRVPVATSVDEDTVHHPSKPSLLYYPPQSVRRRERTPPEVKAARERERELKELEKDTRTIFAYNLNLKADERDLFDFFSKAGKVTDVKIIMDRNTRKSKGFAYIEFDKQVKGTRVRDKGEMVHGWCRKMC